jgi:hypothetical protein
MSSGLELKPTFEPPQINWSDEQGAVEAMVAWFLENFEDPAMITPYETAEGGYQYIWGGPYDASEELYDAFPDANDELIERAANEIQSDGLYDWAPSSTRISHDNEPDENSFQPNIEDRLRALGGQLDNIELHIAYWRKRDPQIGHNGPPNEFKLEPEDVDLIAAETSVAEVRAELAKSDPSNTASVEVIKRAESVFTRLVNKILKGLAALSVTLALGLTTGVAEYAGEHIASNSKAFVKVLNDTAQTLDEWARHLN